jgi:hypothetical protein
MKKNKKPSSNGNDASSAVDISPGILASLADKLKVDLAKPTLASKQSPSSNREKKATQTITPARTSTTNHVPEKNNLDGSRSEKMKKSSGGKIKTGNSSAAEKKQNAPKVVNGKSKREEQHSKEPPKFDPRQSKFSGRSKTSSKTSAISANNGERFTQTKDEKLAAPSLLDEILALGGTKEDLELVDDIDSEEDIPGESQPQSSKKSKGDTDKMACVSTCSADFLVTTRTPKAT